MGSVEVGLIKLFCFEQEEFPYIEDAIICKMRKNGDFLIDSLGHFKKFYWFQSLYYLLTYIGEDIL